MHTTTTCEATKLSVKPHGSSGLTNDTWISPVRSAVVFAYTAQSIFKPQAPSGMMQKQKDDGQ